MIDFDALRAANPLLGFAVYAYDPTGPVTLEITTPYKTVVPFTGVTLAAACALAFPPPVMPAATLEPEVDIFG